MNKHTMGYATLLVLGAALISGTNNFITKIGVTVVSDPVFFTTLKNIVTVVLLMGAVIMLRKWKEAATLTRKEWTQLGLIGVIGGAIPFALFFTGLSMTSALSGALIHKTLVFWVLLFAYPFLKERLSPLALLGVVAVFGANILLSGFKGFHIGTGELLIFAATILWAVENIIAKKTLARVSALFVASARMTIGSVLLLGFLAVSGRMVSVAGLDAAQWGVTLLTGALLFGYVLSWYTALKYAPATYVAALLVPATLVTNILTMVFITHTITGIQIASAALTAVGVGLLVVYGKKTASSATLHAPLHTRTQG